jgi:hypothetical protein
MKEAQLCAAGQAGARSCRLVGLSGKTARGELAQAVNMGVSATTGNAERLQRAAGAWRMEFEQLVYNAPSILRPRKFAVLGEHAILMQLREFSGHEPLAKDAERLFARGALPDGIYVARNGRWLPEMRPESVLQEPEEPEPEPDQLTSGQVEELNDRIGELETMVKNLQRSLENVMRMLDDIASQPRAAAPTAGPAVAATAAAPAPRAAGAGGGGGGRGGIETAGAADSIPAQPPAPLPMPDAPLGKPVTPPTIAALSDLVKSIAGPDAVLQQADRADWPKLAESGPVYAAAFADHDGREAGAMILDIESALRLAGALLMESEEMIASLLEEKMMSDEMLDAASEVCNTLMSAFNKVSGNPHLRVGKLELMDATRLGWVRAARKVDDYRYSHGGRLAMAVR